MVGSFTLIFPPSYFSVKISPQAEYSVKIGALVRSNMRAPTQQWRSRGKLASYLPRNSRPKLIRPMNGERSREVPFPQIRRTFRGRTDFPCLGERKPIPAKLSGSFHMTVPLTQLGPWFSSCVVRT